MKKISSIILIAISYCYIACEPVGRVFYIHNNSDSTVYVCQTCEDSLPIFPLKLRVRYKDTDDTLSLPSYGIPAFSYKDFYILGSHEHPIIGCDDSLLKLYFIKESVLSNNEWETIREKQLYEQKVTLTLDDLKNNDWIYIYDPDR